MKSLEGSEHVSRKLKRREFIISTLSTGFALAAHPLFAQAAAIGKTSEVQNESINVDPAVRDAGINTTSLFLCGDVMTGRGIDQVLPHPGNPTLYEDYMKSAAGYVRLAEAENGPIPRPVDYSYIWGDALDE